MKRFVDGPFGKELPDFNFGWTLQEEGSKKIQKINLPHESRRLPLQYFSEKDFQLVATFKKKFTLTKEKGARYLLNFEGFSTILTLYVNGRFVSENRFGYTGFTDDITDFLVDGPNEIKAVVDSREEPSIPPFGGLIDYLTYNGIYREAHLIKKNENHFRHLRVSWEANNDLVIDAPIKKAEMIFLRIGHEFFNLPFAEDGIYRIPNYKPRRLWHPDHPYLTEICIASEDDYLVTSYGFRHLGIDENKQLTINGKPFKILGLDHHQSYPFIGYAAPKNMQVLDALDLKDLGINTVRCSHYPQSRHFLDACDRLGILVLEELPGWQHIGDAAWKETAVEYVERMIDRDFNHPSIIMWGVRINESQDDHDFYTKTNELAKKMDPNRLRSGTRFIYGSELLEDVYTINDFSYRPDKPVDPAELIQGKEDVAPMLITEFGGHTYPTKKNDNEHRLLDQTLIHLRVANAARKDNVRMGSIGWCAYDYNTHHQFGSGDKICYHGVSDIFRQRKLAASAYRLAIPFKKEPVLDPITYWAFGERNYGGVIPLYVLTNCDYISIQVDGRDEIFLKETDPEFTALPGKVFVVKEMDGSWGNEWRGVTFRGYKDDKVAIVKAMSADQIKSDFKVEISNKTIDRNDALRIHVSLVDQLGNILHFADDNLKIETENCELLGPAEYHLFGGEYAFYVRSDKPGKAKVTISCSGYRRAVTFRVRE